MYTVRESIYHNDPNGLNYKYAPLYKNNVVRDGDKIELKYSNGGVYCDLAKEYETVIDCDGNVIIKDLVIKKSPDNIYRDKLIRDSDIISLFDTKQNQHIGRYVIRNWSKNFNVVLDNHAISLTQSCELVRYRNEFEETDCDKKELIATLKMFEINKL